jgi:hypothetical protein
VEGTFVLQKLIFISLTLVLASCASGYKGDYDFIPPTSEAGMACVAGCEKAKALCEKVCHSDKGECLQRVQEQAQIDFEEYVAAQNAAGAPVTRSLASFEDKKVCYQRGCDCQIEYNECFQLCGGRLVAQAK